MKLATIHVRCDGTPVDFEIHDDGEIEVVGYDIEPDLAAVAMGFEVESECLEKFLLLKSKPFRFMSHHGMLGKLFAEEEVNPVLVVSTAHMTSLDDYTIRRNRGEASGLYYDPTDEGFMFYLDYSETPSESVRAAKNKDNLSRSMVEVLDRAWHNGILRVEFHGDADIIEDIETHEW